MENIISVNNITSDGSVLSLPDQDMEQLLKLITGCAKLGEMTGSQMALIEYLEDVYYKIGYEPGAGSFDICDMPWNACCIQDDKKFLQNLLVRAKAPDVLDALRIKIDTETVSPRLDTLAQMISGFDPESTDRQYADDAKKAGLRFKKNLGWKACFDEERGIYTAERSWRGFYQLSEIDKETYDKLDPAGRDGDYADKLIGEGRVLFEADDDYYTMPYCTVKDENYNELAPWSRAKARYERTYNI